MAYQGLSYRYYILSILFRNLPRHTPLLSALEQYSFLLLALKNHPNQNQNHVDDQRLELCQLDEMRFDINGFESIIEHVY